MLLSHRKYLLLQDSSPYVPPTPTGNGYIVNGTYVGSSNKYYLKYYYSLDTGIDFNPSTMTMEVEADMIIGDSGARFIMGKQSGDYYRFCKMDNVWLGPGYYINGSEYKLGASNVEATGKQKWTFGNRYISILNYDNQFSGILTAPEINSSRRIWLWMDWNTAEATIHDYYNCTPIQGGVKIYSIKVWDTATSEILHNQVATINAGNPCMYDSITNLYHYNYADALGTLIYGED